MSVMDQKARRETDEIVSWIGHYEIGVLALKRETTRRNYSLILQQFLTWLGSRPGHAAPFDPYRDLTQTAVQTYLFDELAGKSISLTSPSMISGTTSAIGCVSLALPWKRWL